MKYLEIIELLKQDEHNDPADRRFENMLDYEDFFQVWYDKKENKYYYVSNDNYDPENDPDDEYSCYEVHLVAELSYKICHEMNIDPNDAASVLEGLFSCCCCGEAFTSYGGAYRWFDTVVDDSICIQIPLN